MPSKFVKPAIILDNRCRSPRLRRPSGSRLAGKRRIHGSRWPRATSTRPRGRRSGKHEDGGNQAGGFGPQGPRMVGGGLGLVVTHKSGYGPHSLTEQKNTEQGMSNFEGSEAGGCHEKSQEVTSNRGRRQPVFSDLPFRGRRPTSRLFVPFRDF